MNEKEILKKVDEMVKERKDLKRKMEVSQRLLIAKNLGIAILLMSLLVNMKLIIFPCLKPLLIFFLIIVIFGFINAVDEVINQ